MLRMLGLLAVLVSCADVKLAREELGRTRMALEGDAGEPAALDVTGVTCTDDALQQLVQPTRETPDAFGHTRIVVDLPTGAKLRICETLEIAETVRVRGNGARIFAHPSTGLVDLVHVLSSAPDTFLEDLHLLYAVASPSLYDHDKVALRVDAARFTLRDTRISGSGYGVVFDATAPGSNVNWPHFDNVVITYCRRAGLQIRGVDASGGYFAGVRILGCENHFDGTNSFGPAVALEESSANGNLFLAPHLEVNDVALRVAPTGGLSPSTFVGGYVEENDPVEWIGNNSLRTTVVGGHLAMLDAVKGDRVGAQKSRLTFNAKSTSGVNYAVRIPGEDQHSFLYFARNGLAYDRWLLKPLLTPPTAPTHQSRVGLQNYMSQQFTAFAVEASHSPAAVDARIDGEPFCEAISSCE